MYTRSNSEKKCNFIGGAKMEQRALINWSVKLKEKKKETRKWTRRTWRENKPGWNRWNDSIQSPLGPIRGSVTLYSGGINGFSFRETSGFGDLTR